MTVWRAPEDSIDLLSIAAANLDLPVHLIRGGLSDIMSDEGLIAFQALVPNAVYTDIAGAGLLVAGGSPTCSTFCVTRAVTLKWAVPITNVISISVNSDKSASTTSRMTPRRGRVWAEG